MTTTGAIQCSEGVFRALVTYFEGNNRVWTNTGSWTTDRTKAEQEMHSLIELAK